MADAGAGQHVDDRAEAEGNDTEHTRQPLRSITSQVGTVDTLALLSYLLDGINFMFIITSWNSTVQCIWLDSFFMFVCRLKNVVQHSHHYYCT